MSRRKREPEAVLIDGGESVLVKHCDELEVARTLAAEALWRADGEPITEGPDYYSPDDGRVIWCRILGALPNSWAAGEGYSWYYDYADGPGRGVFRAVEFLR